MIYENILNLLLTCYTVNSKCRFYIDNMGDTFIIFKCVNVNKDIRMCVLNISKLCLKGPVK